MFGNWVVGVFMRFDSNGAAVMTRLAATTGAANDQLLKQMGYIDANTAALNRYHRQMEQVRISQLRMGTMFAGGVALAGSVAIGEGLKQAANLQTALIGAQINAPGISPSLLRQIVMSVSGRTAQDATTIATEFSTAAATGLTANQLTKGGLFWKLAQAADVLNVGVHHLNPETSVKQLAQLSHIFGIYRGAPLDDMLNSAVKMLSMQPEGLQQLITQGRYFVGNAMARGVPMDDIFKLFTTMGQTGFLKGRGGSGVENIMDYLEGASSLTNHMTKVRRSAFLDLSHAGAAHGLGSMFDSQGRLRFIDSKGDLHLMEAIKYFAQLANYMDKGQFSNDLVNAFGKQGRNFMTVATRPSVVAQNARNDVKWGEIAPISKQWHDYMKSFNFQWQYFATNFKNVVIDIFTPLLPEATNFFNSLGGTLGKFGEFLSANPGAAKNIADTIVALTGIASVRFVIGIGQLSGAVLGFGRTVDLVKNKILLDDAELAAGSVGGSAAGAAGRAGGLWGAADSFLLGGIGGWLVNSAGRLSASIARFLGGPIAGIGPWIARLGRSIGLVGELEGNSILGNLGRLIFGVGQAGSLLGKVIGTVLEGDLFGPLSVAFSLAGNRQTTGGQTYHLVTDASGAKTWMGPTEYAAWQRWEREVKRPVSDIIREGRGAMFNADRRARQAGNMTVGTVNFQLPHGTSEQQGSAAMQHFLNLFGSFAPHPDAPNPHTVGGSNLLFGT